MKTIVNNYLHVFKEMKPLQLKLRYLPFYPLCAFMYQLIKNKGFNLSRFHLVLVYFFRFLLLEPFRILELILYERKINKIEITHPPIFILGHWRSGTSYLQNLICQDPNFTTYSIFRFLLPDIFLISESWLKPSLNWLVKKLKLPYSFQRVTLDLNMPGEMEAALCSLANSTSYTWGHIFPKAFNKTAKKRIYNLTSDNANKWVEDYDYLIRKIALKSGNKQVVVKSPGDTARIKFLFQKYPNAKFIYINRDPIKVFFSNQYLWKAIQKENSVQVLPQHQIDKLIFQNYKFLLLAYNEQKKHIPSNQLFELNYNHLNNNPKAIIQNIYQQLEIKDYPDKEISSFLNKHKTYNKTEYNPSAEMLTKIKSNWHFAFKNQQV
jgi:hypothetical protein